MFFSFSFYFLYFWWYPRLLLSTDRPYSLKLYWKSLSFKAYVLTKKEITIFLSFSLMITLAYTISVIHHENSWTLTNHIPDGGRFNVIYFYQFNNTNFIYDISLDSFFNKFQRLVYLLKNINLAKYSYHFRINK